MSHNDSPGHALQELLLKIIPNDPVGSSREDKRFINRVDYIIQSDGEFSELIYRSTVNYVLRRLINIAIHVERENLSFDRDILVTSLNRSLRTNFSFSDSARDDILTLLIACLDEREKELKTSTKSSFRKTARKLGITKCYICGKDVSFEKDDDDPNPHDKVEIEHAWPKTLGGTNSLENLKIACHKCNQHKKAHIDSTDFHYEYINSVTFVDFNHTAKLAVWAKTDYKCIECKRDASQVGQLSLVKINENDTWHYLNVEAYCPKHASQLKKD